jgi:hypothetical protein
LTLLAAAAAAAAFTSSASKVRTSTDVIMSVGKSFPIQTVPISLLSFDGGGIKGLLSTRLMACSLQCILGTKKKKKSLGAWHKRLLAYVDAFDEPCLEVMWTVWAQQLDSMGVEPQVQPSIKKKWMDFSWWKPSIKKKWMDFSWEKDKKMIRSILRIDLAYEFYIAHVL